MKSLETYAMEWLRYKAGCVLLVNQRSVTYGGGVPDCVGVKRSRHVIEVEVKRSLQDFKANSDKRHIRMRDWSEWHRMNAPRQFYFIVPFALLPKVRPLLPPWAGLLSAPNAFQVQEAHVVVKAPVNDRARKLTLNECVRASALQTNMVLAQHRKIDELKTKLRNFNERKKEKGMASPAERR